MASIVQTEQLTKRYGNVHALDACDLTVEQGEVFGLLGPNGAGKTTLLRMLMGFLKPTGGTARIQNRDCYREATAVHRDVAYLPGEVRLFRWMNGRRVLKFLAEVHPCGDFQRALRVAERLDVDLSRRVSACSSGMRQKIALAAVLALDTPLVILDEPTTHLDPTTRREVISIVREIRDRGRTVLFSSHVLSEVEEVCGRVALLRSGKLVHTQIIDELRRRHRITARLNGPFAELPDDLSDRVTLLSQTNGEAILEAPGELAALLGWLSTLPLEEIRIEPVGLKAVYEEFHPERSGIGHENEEAGS